MAEDLNQVASELGDQIFEKAKASLKEAWEGLPQDAKDGMKRAAQDIAKLQLKAAAGKDVLGELAHAKAAFANWSFVGAVAAKRAFWVAVKDVAATAGELIGKALGGAAKSILKSMM